jgi:hypothetical protein
VGSVDLAVLGEMLEEVAVQFYYFEHGVGVEVVFRDAVVHKSTMKSKQLTRLLLTWPITHILSMHLVLHHSLLNCILKL